MAFHRFSTIMSYFSGPNLFKIPNDHGKYIIKYAPNRFEKIGNLVAASLCAVKWTILICVPFALRKPDPAGALFTCAKYASGILLVYWIAIIVRGYGKWKNSDYRRFVLVLRAAHSAQTAEAMEALAGYDFSFSHWPLEFDIRAYRDALKHEQIEVAPRASWQHRFAFPLTWLVAHTVGVRLAYPGCTAIFNYITAPKILEARDLLQDKYHIRRVRLRTAGGQFVEAFYADNRDSGNKNGDIVMICCEGNAAYPELGNPNVALAQCYSVIGWNHPGFAGSTGMPYPHQDREAIDAVIQFSRVILNFPLDRTLLYAWSIGGYTATWAAMNYPQIRGLILDATFDNLDCLSERVLPNALYPIVLGCVLNHFDLNNADQIKRYPGPVLLIRRGMDELVACDPSERKTNRGNFLLVELLQYRYPRLVTPESIAALWEYLSLNGVEAGQYMMQAGVINDRCIQLIVERVATHGQQAALYPSDLGEGLTAADKTQLLLYLASQYMIEFESTHCVSLPHSLLREPWSELKVGSTDGMGAAHSPANSAASSSSATTNGSNPEWESIEHE